MKRTLLLVAALAALVVPATARANAQQESMFQDDNHLLYASTATVQHVLGILASLGVDRVRVTILWKAIAPDPLSRTVPQFNGADPAAYPPGAWAPYDRVLELAEQHGIGVNFNITAPGPLWAMRHDAPTARSADHFAPAVKYWEQFVEAVGRRYSGTYPASGAAADHASRPAALPPIPGITSSTPVVPAPAAAIPRVHYWTIWNEPNIPGWLAPQSRVVHGRQVENSPRLYREYVDAAWQALSVTSHTPARDTILIGELAPEGYPPLGWYTEMTPMRFLRAFYCVGSNYRPLSGSRASALGCPSRPNRAAFVKAHPGLFHPTGFAHHPYYFFFAPNVIPSNPDFVPLAVLGRLERGLDRIYGNYGVHRRLPIYLTEYGYQTNPPDPYQTVSPARQAVFLNQADYMAYRDPRVRSVAQFLLYDDGPDPRYKPSDFGYWDRFQTGLLYANGTKKPAFISYRLPIWLPSSHIRRGTTVIWGQLRAAPDRHAETASIQWRSVRGSYKTIAVVHVSAKSVEGSFAVRVRIPGSGAVRISWAGQTSRSASVSAG